jgi:hypothetical protein
MAPQVAGAPALNNEPIQTRTKRTNAGSCAIGDTTGGVLDGCRYEMKYEATDIPAIKT